MGNILVVGSINMDMTIFTDRVPQSGETISGFDFLLSPGGKGANQAVAAARMGAQTSMYGCVGDDVFGAELIHVLGQSGVDANGVQRLSGVSTGVASITVCDGDNRIILFAGANAQVQGDTAALQAMMQQCDAVLMQLEIPLPAVLDVIDMANRARKPVYLTPAPAVPLPDEVYKKVDYLLPNETESSILLGKELVTDQEMHWALNRFFEMGVKNPVITMGERGVGCLIEGRPRIIKGYTVKPVDTTAAGDTFTGAFANSTIAGMPMEEAILFAQKAAALCITRQGAQNAIPTRDEVERAQLMRA